jgi:hypothetical protein
LDTYETNASKTNKYFKEVIRTSYDIKLKIMSNPF